MRWKYNQDYLYIKAWGILLRSYKYYIDEEVDRAKKDGAPENAIYRAKEGDCTRSNWITLDEIVDHSTKEAVKHIAEVIKLDIDVGGTR